MDSANPTRRSNWRNGVKESPRVWKVKKFAGDFINTSDRSWIFKLPSRIGCVSLTSWGLRGSVSAHKVLRRLGTACVYYLLSLHGRPIIWPFWNFWYSSCMCITSPNKKGAQSGSVICSPQARFRRYGSPRGWIIYPAGIQPYADRSHSTTLQLRRCSLSARLHLFILNSLLLARSD